MDGEKEAFLTQQLITCIGNKRALLNFIGCGIEIAKERLGKSKLRIIDVFSGSGIVARYFKQSAELLIANDLELYSALINRCYLSNENELDMNKLREYHSYLTNEAEKGLYGGIIRELYAPKDENEIKKEDRVFYTVRNAKYLDTVRQLIDKLPEKDRMFFIAPLLSEASIHANTSGVFKGFYKNKEGIGQYGGHSRDALSRITGNINLPFPVFSNFEAEILVYNENANELIHRLPELDLAYLDPPYNQHPYGSNYFMLNLITDYKRPAGLSAVSGIPKNWNRSSYNNAHDAYNALGDLVNNINAKFVLVSFNSDGFISLDDMRTMLEKNGKVEVIETEYNTFRGSRNLNNREIHVKEYLFLLEKL